MILVPSRFIGQEVRVEFTKEPIASKNPHCPDRLHWDGTTLEIKTLLEEWRDHTRRGRMERNMRESNLRRSARTGSWGVGRIYFRVQVEDGRFFDLYYDRAPTQTDGSGQWFLYRELEPGGS